jgi:predicted permease
VSLLAVIVPIAVVVAAGYVLARRLPVETRTLSRVTIYLFSPCLVFTALVRLDLARAGGDRLVALIVVHTLALLALAATAAALLRLPREERSGLGLCAVLYNAGNYGLPASLFAFGQEGFRLATVVYVLSAILAYSLGIFLASAGHNTRWRAAADIFRLPLIYAAAAGLAVGHLGITVPEALWRPLELMGQAAIPMLLVALGVQLAQAPPAVFGRALWAAGALRLAASPVLTVLLIPVFGVSGTAAKVAVLSTSMPVAVNAFLLAAQFGTAPAFVASAVVLTTVASFATVSLVLLLLR